MIKSKLYAHPMRFPEKSQVKDRRKGIPMLYNISFDICAAVITLIALYLMFFGRDLERKSNRIFLAVIIMHMISVIFDIWSSVVNSYVLDQGIFTRDFANYVFLGVHTSEAVVFFWFLLVQLGTYAEMTRGQRMLLWVPEIVMILLPLMLNFFFPCVFYYDELGFYVHGPAMILLYAGADFYMVLCIVFVFWKRERLTRMQRRAALMLLLLSVIPMLIQSILIPRQLIEMFFQALGLYGYMLSVENVDESRSPVTRAWNRHALTRDFAFRIMNGERICTVVVKVSQRDTLKVAAQGSQVFHGIRLHLAEWFDQKATGKSKRFYDCERGIYVVLITGENMEEESKEICSEIASRFQKEWRYASYSTTISAQITTVEIPENTLTLQEFLYMLSQPYVHQEKGIVYKDCREILQSFSAGGGEAQELPQELRDSLDCFLAGISRLTPAERNIFDMYIDGYAIGEIPDKAYISMNTVKKHNKNIYRKLGVSSREELMLYIDLFRQCGRMEDLYREKEG